MIISTVFSSLQHQCWLLNHAYLQEPVLHNNKSSVSLPDFAAWLLNFHYRRPYPAHLTHANSCKGYVETSWFRVLLSLSWGGVCDIIINLNRLVQCNTSWGVDGVVGPVGGYADAIFKVSNAEYVGPCGIKLTGTTVDTHGLLPSWGSAELNYLKSWLRGVFNPISNQVYQYNLVLIQSWKNATPRLIFYASTSHGWRIGAPSVIV